MSEVVLVEDRGPIRRVTLNRPDKLNALNQGLTDSLSIALAEAAESDEVRVVVLAGSGRSFCAGYDLEEGSFTERAAILKSLNHSLGRLLEVFDHPKPVIAEVHGHCLAGGCDLMMMCDLAVASDDAVFGQPEIRFGSTVVAQELILTGNEIDAIEAERIGLVNRVVPRDRLGDETMRLARELAVVDPVAMRLTKQAINRSWEAAGFREALQEGVEIGAEIESARVPEREEFERIATERGLKKALRWRDERFDAND
jgi:enoyl-CoA hydratase